MIVETESGRIEGVDAAGVSAFRGIPYAEPPVGPLRLRAPQPVEPWAGVREAQSFGRIAPQVDRPVGLLPRSGLEMDEDCLTLNVFTPGADAARRPVLVWIHGGAFVSGSGSSPLFDGSPLATRGDVVVVTLNYRLGALGFLYLDDLGGEAIGADANRAMLDQIAALGWVKRNIAAFGGDPENVTVFGESAGGISVATLLAMPGARGLFRRAIAQSGAGHNAYPRGRASEIAEEFLHELAIEPADLHRLHELPWKELVAAQAKVTMNTFARHAGAMSFQPTIDGRSLPAGPLEAVAAGAAADTPLLIGTTRDEWRFFAPMDSQLLHLDHAALLERVRYRVGDCAEEMVAVYERDGHSTPPQIFCAIETDRIFGIPAIRLADAQAAHQQATYRYLFTYASPAFDGRLGSCHALELPFVFGTLGASGIEDFAGTGPEATALSERMMDAWITFARTDQPSHASLTPWSRYAPDRRMTMILDVACGEVPDPTASVRAVWEGVL